MKGTVGGVAGLKIKVLSEAERATANFCFRMFRPSPGDSRFRQQTEGLKFSSSLGVQGY